MSEQYRLEIGKDSIRFTGDGKVAVLDAIKSLSATKEPESVWESLKDKNPQLQNICQKYAFVDSRSVPVVDEIGWRKIEAALADYVYQHVIFDM